MADLKNTPQPGKLYLIPTGLGNVSLDQVLPVYVKEKVSDLHWFIAENEKTARRFIKELLPEKQQSELHFHVLNKHTEAQDLPNFLSACEKGLNMGLLSEAGCPGVADPGARIVEMAHQRNIEVVPLVGPSSIILAMMASGMNGQNFSFLGYLPIDKNERKNSLKQIERISSEQNQAQIFIETPYRNDKLLDDLKKHLHPQTRLCIACELTLPTAYIRTKTIREWQKENPDLHKKPAIFIIQAGG